ncbi:uncharacterized protein K02A2.6 [Aplysia californica]|uniref:Uncharacterized protein K02A2.6 n=1 Tax=Aplysia californica TaxID=6500 RepID=A0ABM1A7X8_APLCA|nr:uncharacterized protein K02A2.6 [Aplysia californica]
MKAIFARHGIPLQLVTDNGPQFSSTDFRKFTESWEIEHKTSSPLYPRSNGLAERTVQTVKQILTKAKDGGEDPYLSILNFRTTDKSDQASPAEMLMGRKLRTLLPSANRIKRIVSSRMIKDRKDKHAKYYNSNTKDLATLKPQEFIRYRDSRSGTWEPAQVKKQVDNRSYIIRTKRGLLRRNRQHLLQSGEPHHDLQPDQCEGGSYRSNVHNNVPAPIIRGQAGPQASRPLVEFPNSPRNDHEVYEHTPDRGGTPPSPEHSDTHNVPHYITRSGRTVRKPNKYTL